MKKFIAAALFVLAAATSSIAADDAGEKAAALKRLFAAAPPEAQMQEAKADFFASTPKEYHEGYTKIINLIDIKKIESAMAESVERNFSAKEINALAAFYETPEGKSIMKKYAKVQADMVPILKNEIMRVMTVEAVKQRKKAM